VRRPYEKATNEENKKKHDYFVLAAKANDLEHHINQAKQYATPTSEKDIRQLQVRISVCVCA
jgi:ribosomal protein S15P/S13E